MKGRASRAIILASNQPGRAAEKAVDAFLSIQDPTGYWVFDLEADVTIPSEYVFLRRVLGWPLEAKVAHRLRNYILSRQLPDGGWPLFDVDGHTDISASVKAYLALKLLGDSPTVPHMVRARQLILSLGGAARANVFTRIALAMLGQVPWHTAPAMPVEMMLLPRWFFFHLSKMSYWSRTVIVPLLILYSKKPVCSLRPEESIAELFTTPPDELGTMDPFRMDRYIHNRWRKNGFILTDRVLKRVESAIPGFMRRMALRRAEEWTLEHMGGSGGIGAIFPAMANAVMALKSLGYPEDHPDFDRGVRAIDDLMIHRLGSSGPERGFTTVSRGRAHWESEGSAAIEEMASPSLGLSVSGDQTLVQPCVSPVWDTCLTLSALMEAGVPPAHTSVRRCVQWLLDKQVFVRGDWSEKIPEVEPGGWAFQFENAQFPDVDDTCSVVMALLRADAVKLHPESRERIARAVNWVIGMQNRDGGWGAFDANNDALYLNDIPFADHGALLDPSTADVTGRAIEMLGMLGHGMDCGPVRRGIEYLKKEQETDGPWFGRWGVNYIYGTWSVLGGLRMVGEDMDAPYVRKAVAWLEARQNADGGWGESCHSYRNPRWAGMGASTPSQTSWALMALMAAGEYQNPATHAGIRYLLEGQGDDGFWSERHYTGTGFPNVFYLRYHGYSRYFPLWTLALYSRNADGLPEKARIVDTDGLAGFEPVRQGFVARSLPRAVKRAVGALGMSRRVV